MQRGIDRFRRRRWRIAFGLRWRVVHRWWIGALDHALAQAAVLELVFPEDLAGVAASGGQDEVSSDRYS